MGTGWHGLIRQCAALVVGLFAVCTLLAGLSVLGSCVCDAGSAQAPPLGPLLRQEFKDWYAMGLISLGVIWFATRNRLEPNHTGRWVAIHFAAATGFAA